MTAVMHTPRPLHRRFARALLCAFVSLLATVVINVVGIGLVGDVSGWSRWLDEHSRRFTAWRAVLYVATALGWWWLRGRVLRREPSSETRARLLRTEIAAVLTIAALETSMLLQTR